MTQVKHTPGPWRIGTGDDVVTDHKVDGVHMSHEAFQAYGGHLVAESIAPQNRPLIAAAPDLLDALEKAQEIINEIREDLHSRRVADWFPEGAHNAANSMSEDMRLIGNRLADVDFSYVIVKARGES